jgi:hypothetical protein
MPPRLLLMKLAVASAAATFSGKEGLPPIFVVKPTWIGARLASALPALPPVYCTPNAIADWLNVPAAAGVAVAAVAEVELAALELVAELLLLLLLLPQAASAKADRTHTTHAGASRPYSLIMPTPPRSKV